MVDQMLSSTQGTSLSFPTPDLEQVTQQLDSAVDQVAKLMEGEKKMPSGSTSSSASSTQDLSSKSFAVGVDEDLLQLKDRLTGMQRKLVIVPIVGMGGIGKTAIARNLYNDSLIVSHFGARGWATISQDYNMKEVLSELLYCITGIHFDQPIHELQDMLYNRLFGRRYMIVLDDIWSTKFWDDIRRYFPDNNDRSRIVLTTRDSDVAIYTGLWSWPHHVQLLSRSESWNLLCRIVFQEDACPLQLQGIGKEIADKCCGLPLSVHVVGGILLQIERSTEAWENISKDVTGAISKSDERVFSILSLSYNHLPSHLKPCFLYMSAFPEDYEIKASRLVRLWVAEGFLKSNGNKSLEGEAEHCLNALVGRNLLLVREAKCNGKPKRYSMHDLVRHLCIKKANEEFLHEHNVSEITNSNMRRVSIHTSVEMEDVHAMSFARSILYTGPMSRGILSPAFFMLRLLRVLDVMEMKFQNFPREILQLVNLRYLSVFCYSSLPCGISRLFNLQTLIANLGWGDLPSEIWEMPTLRHLKVNEVILVEDEYMITFVQSMLQTISSVMLTPSLLRNGFFQSIPNVKNLGIYCDTLLSSVVDLGHLYKLETLRCESSLRHLLPTLIFPSTLGKLTLVGCVISENLMTTLSALPYLEVLIIKRCVFENEETCQEWEVAEGDEFRSLQFLRLERLDLLCWRADEMSFPRLRTLTIKDCSELEEIPSTIGDIPTLELIDIYGCRPSAVASVKHMQEEQRDSGNYDFQCRITDDKRL